MRRESPLYASDRFAMERRLLAEALDGVSYDIATFAEHELDYKDGEEIPCSVLAWCCGPMSRISDGKTIVVPHPPLTKLCADIALILCAMQQQIPMSSVVDSAEENA